MSEETLASEAVEPAPTSEVTAASDVADNGAPGAAEPEPERTFTQAELDAKIGEAKAKTERKLRREWEQAQAAESLRPAHVAPPQPEQFTTEADYVEAVIDYRAELKLAQRENQKQHVDANATYGERAEAAREKYPDFEMAHKLPADGGPSITDEMAAVIKGSELGPEIAYHLFKNLSESRRISALSPLQQAMEIGKIEARLNNTPAPVKKASSAPAPITPVGSRTHTPSYDVTDPRFKGSDSEWIKARNQQVAKRAQG